MKQNGGREDRVEPWEGEGRRGLQREERKAATPEMETYVKGDRSGCTLEEDMMVLPELTGVP